MPPCSDSPRNQFWLEATLASVWQRHFYDVMPGNRVVIRFGRVAKTRLGSIRMSRDKKTSVILINRLFQSTSVPMEIVEATIAHELVHYLHGFSSPFEQKFSTPHAGGVVTKELKKRGFGPILVFQKQWLKEVWPKLVRAHVSVRVRRIGSVRRVARSRRHWLRAIMGW